MPRELTSGLPARKKASTYGAIEHREAARELEQQQVRSECLVHVAALKPADIASDVVLYHRSSGSMDHQKRSVRECQETLGKKLRAMGYGVRESFTEHRSGRLPLAKRRKLVAAGEYADQHGLPLVVLDIWRLVRHPDDDTVHPMAEQLQAIRLRFPRLKIMSYYDPGLSYEEVHRLKSLDPDRKSPRKNGRPTKDADEEPNSRCGPKKPRRETMLPRIIKYVRAHPSESLHSLARRFDVHRSTLRRWLQKVCLVA